MSTSPYGVDSTQLSTDLIAGRLSGNVRYSVAPDATQLAMDIVSGRFSGKISYRTSVEATTLSAPALVTGKFQQLIRYTNYPREATQLTVAIISGQLT